jgi:hypothetical protein
MESMTGDNKCSYWGQGVIAVVVILLISFFPLSSFGADFYIDPPNGNDSNSGTIDSPWKTLGRARRSAGTVAPGDTVFIRGGTITYSSSVGLMFGSSDSGAAGSPITYKTYPGEEVTIHVVNRNLAIRNNRYFNSHIYQIDQSHHVLIEENEGYYFHRHAIAAAGFGFDYYGRSCPL